MQNRCRNFRVYHSTLDVLKKSPGEMFRGILMHIPRNVLVAMTGLKITDQVTLASYYGVNIFFQTLAYPFLTVQRRLEVRSQLTGFLPESSFGGRGSFISCASELIKQEGVRALWRGYPAHLFALILWMSMMPAGTDFVS